MGKGEWEGECERSRMRSSVKVKEGEQRKGYLDSWSHCGISKKPGTREIPLNLQG